MGVQQVILDDGAANAVDPAAALSAQLDAAFGNTRGALITRLLNGWALLAPGTLGYVLASAGADADIGWTAPGAGGAGGGGGFTYASAAPVGPAIGDRWVDSDIGVLYVFVNDGTSSQWVEF